MNPFKQADSWADKTHKKLLSVADTSNKPYTYTISCVQSTADLINAMAESAEDITHAEMAKNCDLKAVEWAFKYIGTGLSLEEDWHVTFHKSTYDGKDCYFLDHSRIEWIWVMA